MHLDIGKEGEQIAAQYLELHGYHILERNWRYGRFEIDLIAMDGETIVFVEVKTQTSDVFITPDTRVGQKKQGRISFAAAQYMEFQGFEWSFRFDILTVLLSVPDNPEISHIRDAFFPGLD